jgi:hypothetical protein
MELSNTRFCMLLVNILCGLITIMWYILALAERLTLRALACLETYGHSTCQEFGSYEGRHRSSNEKAMAGLCVQRQMKVGAHSAE